MDLGLERVVLRFVYNLGNERRLRRGWGVGEERDSEGGLVKCIVGG